MVISRWRAREGETSVVAGRQHMAGTHTIYGNVSSLGGALRSNPTEFARHLAAGHVIRPAPLYFLNVLPLLLLGPARLLRGRLGGVALDPVRKRSVMVCILIAGLPTALLLARLERPVA